MAPVGYGAISVAARLVLTAGVIAQPPLSGAVTGWVVFGACDKTLIGAVVAPRVRTAGSLRAVREILRTMCSRRFTPIRHSA